MARKHLKLGYVSTANISVERDSRCARLIAVSLLAVHLALEQHVMMEVPIRMQ
jgi:hypothetical protein